MSDLPPRGELESDMRAYAERLAAVNSERDTMTATELVRALRSLIADGKLKPNAKVYSEGCDCFGDVRQVIPEKNGSAVSLMREVEQ